MVIDRALGDPRSNLHPVAVLGRWIGYWGRPCHWPEKLQRLAGVVMWIATVGLFCVPCILFSLVAPWYVYLLLGPFILKSMFAWRSLEDHMEAVVEAATTGLAEGRMKVGMMVSRDTAILSREQVLSAGYESVTENLTDSIVAPILYFGIAGLAGAALYRAANTMDAMLGYRDGRERIGWWSAKADDLLSCVPARLTGLLLLAYFAMKGRFRPAYECFKSDRKKRPGYNGGIPMAVMAGGVGVCFEKPGVYRIGNPHRSLEEAGPEIIRAGRWVTVLWATITGIALLLMQLSPNM
ncbi:MAG: adenosylcobinamide-phosphate synthase CbiB [Methanoregulaceae archaeon]|nr:adenosylcobinamide-phosphate synthase CbiB [Methanoregulaceae archaeon]